MLHKLLPAAMQVDVCEAGQCGHCCNVCITDISKHQLQLLQSATLQQQTATPLLNTRLSQ
jgi:hypothetical protein